MQTQQKNSSAGAPTKYKVLYQHLKPNGEVFYIGIGDPKRPFKKSNRNKHWKNIVSKYGYEVQILKTNLTWEEACELERILIDYYGRKDLGKGTLVNLTDGGDGNINYICTIETRNKMSKAKQNMSDETKQKISSSLKGVKHSEERRNKSKERNKNKVISNLMREKCIEARSRKVICTETNKIWDSVKLCSLDVNINYSTLKDKLRGFRKNNTTLRYL